MKECLKIDFISVWKFHPRINISWASENRIHFICVWIFYFSEFILIPAWIFGNSLHAIRTISVDLTWISCNCTHKRASPALMASRWAPKTFLPLNRTHHSTNKLSDTIHPQPSINQTCCEKPWATDSSWNVYLCLIYSQLFESTH